MVNGGLCDGCSGTANEACETVCPFNSDEAPPKLDDRSDAKGPEPECVTTGTMSDGTILSFVGLERTGGIMVYDVSTPATPVFQDFLNVRNWRNGETVDNDEVAKNLNDGPESLVFISASDSPTGQALLLAATPLAGRLTAYAISSEDTLRGNDGSCATTATCGYISAADGGTGTIRDNMNICNWCASCSAAYRTQMGCDRTYSFSLTAAGSVSDFTATMIADIKTAVATQAGVAESQVTVSISAASVLIQVTISANSEAELATIAAAVDPLLTDATAAAPLVPSTVSIEAVTSAPTQAPSAPPPVSSDDSDDIPSWGAAVIAVCAVFAVCFCVLFIVMMAKERQGKPIFLPMSGGTPSTKSTSDTSKPQA